MAWIESHQELARHPKTMRLARELGEPIRSVIGLLHLLWWWAMDYAQDGDLTGYEAEDIADAVMWDGDPDVLLQALIKVRFIDADDEGMRIHDWDEYAGRLIEKRAKNAERKRMSRARHADVTRTDAGQASDGNESHRATITKPIPKHNQTDRERDLDPATREIVRAYEEVCGPLKGDPSQLMTLVDYVDQGMDIELVIHAIRKSSTADHPAKYADAILRSYQRKGIRTLADAQEREPPRDAQRKAKEATDRGAHRTSSGASTEDDAYWDELERRYFGG